MESKAWTLLVTKVKSRCDVTDSPVDAYLVVGICVLAVGLKWSDLQTLLYAAMQDEPGVQHFSWPFEKLTSFIGS